MIAQLGSLLAVQPYRKLALRGERTRDFANFRAIPKLHIMRINYLLPVAALSLAALSNAQSIDQKLKFVRETIDAHAETHQFEPPAKSSGTKWQVTRIEGCTIELKQTSPSRSRPTRWLSARRLFGISEDRIATWTFDLGNLRPQLHHGRFHRRRARRHFRRSGHLPLKTDVTQRTLRKDGTVAGTSTWSAPGTAPNLWIYFDSASGDNNQLVKQVESDLQSAVMQCMVQSRNR